MHIYLVYNILAVNPSEYKNCDEEQGSALTGIRDKPGVGEGDPVFVIQKHRASTLHYDLRLEIGGVLKSWAIPKGPSMDPKVKRLAVPTEDHPLSYGDFEGVIPEGSYGAGVVIIWDRGTFSSLKDGQSSLLDALDAGHITLSLKGSKLVGGFALIRTKGSGKRPRWLFFKMRDEYARPGSDITSEMPNSVKTGLSLDEVAEREPPTPLKGFM